MKTLKDFIKENNIRMSYERVEENPNMNWSSARHYKTILKMDNRQMTVYFSMGLGLSHEPTIEEVLDCIAMDSFSYLNDDSFEDFCKEFGYDIFNKQHKKVYDNIMKQGKKAEKFLTRPLLEELVYEVERL